MVSISQRVSERYHGLMGHEFAFGTKKRHTSFTDVTPDKRVFFLGLIHK